MGGCRRREGGIAKRTLGVGGYVHYLNCGDAFTGVSICKSLPNWTL
jgi:hypothetical protein